MSENNRPDSEQKKDQTTAEDILAQVDSILADLENSAVAQLFAAPEKNLNPKRIKNRLKKKNQRRPASLSRRTRMRNSRKPIHRTKVKANLRRRKRRPRKRQQLSLQSPRRNQTQLRNRRKMRKTNLTKKKIRRMRPKTRATGTNRNLTTKV